MIVSELVAELQKMPQGVDVFVENDCGDGRGIVRWASEGEQRVTLGFCCENIRYAEDWD